MTRDLASAPLLTSAQLDAIASAIDFQTILPFTPPARPFTVGTMETFGIRREYRAQSPIASLAPEGRPEVQRLAERLARALSPATVVDIAPLVPSISSATPTQLSVDNISDAVLLCVDVLQRVEDPAPILAWLVSALAQAVVAVIAVPLRPMLRDSDDLGPPRDAAFAREWNFPELQAGLDAAGLEPLFGGVLPDDSGRSDAIGVVIVTTRTPTARANAQRLAI